MFDLNIRNANGKLFTYTHSILFLFYNYLLDLIIFHFLYDYTLVSISFVLLKAACFNAPV